MPNDEDLYKREEDQKWRTKVDHEQITLMTGHQVLRDKVDELKQRIDSIDKDREILLREYDRHDDRLTKLYAVIFQDPTGQKGLLHDVDTLMGRRKASQTASENAWKYWTAVTVAVISLVGLFVTNFDKVEPNIQRLKQFISGEDRDPPKAKPRGRKTPAR